MTRIIRSKHPGRPVAVRERQALCGLILVAAAVLGATTADAWVEPRYDLEERLAANPILVTDGSYFMNAGNLHMHIANLGFIGSMPASRFRWSDAPSAQWPAGSGNEYLYAAGLWVGGVLLGERLVSTGAFDFYELLAQRDPEDTVYEAVGGKLIRPAGNMVASGRRFPEPEPNDDGDNVEGFPDVPLIDEEILNGYDDDDDGLIDEDFAQIGNQMMVVTLYDNTALSMELNPDHKPLNLKIVQESYAWENQMVRDFVGFDYTITNIGVTTINDMYLGMYVDSDIAPSDLGSGAGDDMAGSFSGAVRASDGSWVPVSVGYMYDAPEEPPILEGYFGCAFLGHTTDPTGNNAPQTVKLRAFRHFSGNQPFQQGGDPTNDAERYEVLSTEDIQNNVQEGREEDYRFMVSAGPFEELAPDESLTFQVAFVAGTGLEGLLRNTAEAVLTYYGNYFDRIPPQTAYQPDAQPLVIGERGRETIICREDFDQPNDFNQIFPDFGDMTCAPSLGWLQERFQTVQDSDLFYYARDPRFPDRTSVCVMVNMDNCFECYRKKNHGPGIEDECTAADLDTYWDCWDPDGDPAGCTGVGGRESQIKWLVGMAPPAPGVRVWPTDSGVHVFWDNRSEISPDVRLNVIDFQSYRVWRADNWTRPFGTDLTTGPSAQLWQLVAEYDVVDSFVIDHDVLIGGQPAVVRDTLPLGRNTGLEAIRYPPRILEEERFVGLREAMQEVASRDSSGLYNAGLPPLFLEPGVPRPLTEPLLPWQGYPAALDTFWAVTARPGTTFVDEFGETISITAKDSIWYYEYVDPMVHNGFLYFYAVSATDHELEPIPGSDPPRFINRGQGLIGDPSSSFTNTSPGRLAQTVEERARDGANIFVYPNPATRQALEEFQELNPSLDDPTGVRIRFANLPAARNTIKIYTLSGDLVQTIEHDGTGGYGEASWNLISRNMQEIVSGIYLYVVQSSASGFDDFIGKFVVVR